MVVGAHGVLAGRLGALAGGQHFVLQARGELHDAFALGVVGQEFDPGGRSGVGLGLRLGLHALADHLEAGRQFGLADPAGLASEGVAQAGDHGFEADARRRVVAQLIAELAADTVADAGFVDGEIEFGHWKQFRKGQKGRPD
ncbi:hypothetical protein D9M69_423950 [compost metagenome]